MSAALQEGLLVERLPNRSGINGTSAQVAHQSVTLFRRGSEEPARGVPALYSIRVPQGRPASN